MRDRVGGLGLKSALMVEEDDDFTSRGEWDEREDEGPVNAEGI